MSFKYIIKNIDTEKYVKTTNSCFGGETDNIGKARKYSKSGALRALVYSKTWLNDKKNYIILKVEVTYSITKVCPFDLEAEEVKIISAGQIKTIYTGEYRDK